MDFEVGDEVELYAGGQKMTVMRTEGDGLSDTDVWCEWKDGYGNLQGRAMPKAGITKIPKHVKSKTVSKPSGVRRTNF